MRCLFFNLASHNGQIACVSDDSTTSMQQVDHQIRDHELLPIVQALLQESSWPLDSLTHIACVLGPGGFTSLRVAVTAANVFADQLHIPSAGIHLSDLFHAQCPERDVLWLHSTKAQELFVRGFGSFSAQWPEPTHIQLDTLTEKLPKEAFWVGELLPTHREHLQCEELTSRCALRDMLSSFLQSLEFTHEPLLPWYGREW